MSGRFVWYELMTSDTEKAIAFYTDVVGWKTEPYGDRADPYTMWTGSQGPLGGVMALPEEAKKMGAPPHWGSYVEVDDVDASTDKAKSLGAKVLFGPYDIPKIGRYTLIADPQGATISLFKPIEPMKPHDTTKPGEVSWNELYAKDNVAALEFYKKLFGWRQISEMDMGPAGKYLIYGQGDQQYGGMMTLTPEMKSPPAWAYYFNVVDLDETIEKAKARDAKLMVGPMDVPGGSRVAILTDPQGAVFALHEPKKG